MRLVNFNSIKVQLKQLKIGLPSATLRFQFHKGTIKTIVSKRICGLVVISIP